MSYRVRMAPSAGTEGPRKPNGKDASMRPGVGQSGLERLSVGESDFCSDERLGRAAPGFPGRGSGEGLDQRLRDRRRG